MAGASLHTLEHIAEVEHVLDDIASEGLLVKHMLPGSVGLYYLPGGEDE
jgi:hypothetical protein